MRQRFRTGTINSNINAIQAEVCKLNLTQGLRFCSEIARKQFEENKPVEEKKDAWLASWFTAYLAKELLLRASDKATNELDMDLFKQLSRWFAHADVGHLEARSMGDDLDKLRRQITLHFERQIWIEPIKSVMARIYFTLYEAPLPHYEPFRSKWADEFRALYGIDFPAFFQAAMGVFFCVQRLGYFDRGYLTRATDTQFQGWFTDENIDSILAQFCCTEKEFRVNQRQYQSRSPIRSMYEFNYLRRKPLIRNENGDIIAPSPVLMADRLSTGVHFDLIESLNRQKRDFREFTADYGKLFEGYVGKLLCEFYELDNGLHSADDYFNKKEKNLGIPDWIVFEGDAVILIECKASKMPLDVLTSTNTVRFRNLFIERYLNGGKTQFEHSYKHFTDLGKDVYTLIVYNDYLSFYNDYDLVLFDKAETADNLRKYRTAFASVYDFEKTLPLLKHVKLGDILEKKWSTPELRRNDLSLTAETYPQFSMAPELETVTHVWRNVFGMEPEDANSTRDE